MSQPSSHSGKGRPPVMGEHEIACVTAHCGPFANKMALHRAVYRVRGLQAVMDTPASAHFVQDGGLTWKATVLEELGRCLIMNMDTLEYENLGEVKALAQEIADLGMSDGAAAALIRQRRLGTARAEPADALRADIERTLKKYQVKHNMTTQDAADVLQSVLAAMEDEV